MQYTHDESEELGQTLWSFEDDVSIEERGGELKEGERETGRLCERRLVAELENLLLDFGGEEGERSRGGRGHLGGLEVVVDGRKEEKKEESGGVELTQIEDGRSSSAFPPNDQHPPTSPFARRKCRNPRQNQQQRPSYPPHLHLPDSEPRGTHPPSTLLLSSPPPSKL